MFVVGVVVVVVAAVGVVVVAAAVGVVVVDAAVSGNALVLGFPSSPNRQSQDEDVLLWLFSMHIYICI